VIRRLLVAALLSTLLVAAAVTISWVRTGPLDLPVATEGAPRTGPDLPAPETAPPAPGGPTPLPTDPAAAEELGGDELLAAAEQTAVGEWEPLGHPAWEVRERPVYVGRAELGDRRHVDADLVIAFRADESLDEVPLRLLPGARALERGGLEVVVRRDGRAASHRVDRNGARLLVTLDPPVAAEEAVVLRVMLRYDLLPHDHIPPDAGPPSFGLLAWTPVATVLGHWLPLLTVDGGDGPMPAVGDVGAFPAAVWSLVIDADAALVSGGDEADCPEPRAGCTWVRGVALREVALVVYDRDPVRYEDEIAGLRLRTVAPPRLADSSRLAHAHAGRAAQRYTDELGPLAWRGLDVAAVPLDGRAAGMEFPGLVLIDLAMFGSMLDGFGATVVVHEVAHQWFHALVGNASSAEPVVDEATAQYLTYVHWAEEFGQDAGERLAQQMFLQRYGEALRGGMRDGPPARAAEEFDDEREYGVLVYARAPLGLVVAEQRIGRAEVVDFLRRIVARHGLEEVDAATVLAESVDHHPELGEQLERWWFAPSP
jgi:hypothetical protein